MKTALIQKNYLVGDLKGNMKKMIDAVKQAKLKGADLCVSSELALTGYPMRDLLFNRSFIKKTHKILKEMAQHLKEDPPLLVGVPELSGNQLFNSAAYLNKGLVKCFFQKSLLPHYDVFEEKHYFTAAESLQYLDINGAKIAVTICEDLWKDNRSSDFVPLQGRSPLENSAFRQAALLVNLSASPFVVGKQNQREKILHSISERFHKPLVYVNQVGGNDDLIFDGGSCAFDQNGELIARAKAFEEDLVIVDIQHQTGEISLIPSPLETLWKALVLGVRDYAFKTGFKKVILGLSGGIDSALVAVIAAHALGSENVLGILMPSPYSSQGSLDDSIKLSRNIHIPIETIPIKVLMQTFDTSLGAVFKGTQQDVTEENLQSRIRGNLLMAISNKFRYLLLATGNKSEISVGYSTIYGDMAGGLAVISDLSKTMVFRLSRWINHVYGNIIPEEIINKRPSAELRPDQYDTDTLPDYPVLDEILELLIERHQSADDLVEKGYDKLVVEKIQRLIALSEFKRKQMPPGIKVTNRAFGTGWRMPIAAY